MVLFDDRTTLAGPFSVKSRGWRDADEQLRQSAYPGGMPRLARISSLFIPHRATTAHAELVHAA